MPSVFADCRQGPTVCVLTCAQTWDSPEEVGADIFIHFIFLFLVCLCLEILVS